MPHCPCCRQTVDENKLKRTAPLLPFDGFPMPVHARASTAEAFLQVAGSYPSLFQQWACDDCIDSGKAILAKPKKQYYTFQSPWDTAIPYLAYFDQQRKCEACKQWYTFSKEEQQHWYEDLQFVVYSKPKQCLDCRKVKRKGRDVNTELSALLRDGRPEDPDQLARIAELYGQMGKEEKQKAYARAAEKLRKQQ